MKNLISILILFVSVSLHSQSILIDGDELNIGSTATADLSFEVETYASSISKTYDPLRPNFAITLSGDISLNITGATAGGGAVTITRGSGYEEVVLVGEKGNHFYFPQGASSVIRLVYSFEPNGLTWYYVGREASIDVDDYNNLVTAAQDQITDIVFTQQLGGTTDIDGQ